ncbi:MAG: hypothetical protein V4693_14280 [Pseudomonadota bacterium]
MLGQLGFKRVATAANGRCALGAVASAHPPELIPCDLNMPEIDGIDSTDGHQLLLPKFEEELEAVTACIVAFRARNTTQLPPP